MKIYSFRAPVRKGNHPPVAVLVAPAKEVNHYISKQEYPALFGGYYARTISTKEYLGVYGIRTASRFRRILRERGADIELINANPPGPNATERLLQKLVNMHQALIGITQQGVVADGSRLQIGPTVTRIMKERRPSRAGKRARG